MGRDTVWGIILRGFYIHKFDYALRSFAFWDNFYLALFNVLWLIALGFGRC